MATGSTMEGRTIKKVRCMTPAELAAEGWETKVPVIALEMDNGCVLYPASDDEGNDAGALFGVTAEGRAIQLMPEES